MLPEDRLDALLSENAMGAAGSPTWQQEDDVLAPLLAAAESLDTFHAALPSGQFAETLEVRLLAHAAMLTRDLATAGTDQYMVASLAEDLPENLGDDPPAISDGDFPTIPIDGMHQSPAPAYVARRVGQEQRVSATPHRRPRSSRYGRILWQAIAAALVLAIGAGTLTAAAAAAGPGSLLFALHRWEQGVRVSLSASPADRVRLHLQYASDALATLDRAVATRAGDPTYSDALATLAYEERAAAGDLKAVPAGSERDALAAQLSTLHQRARQDLRAALLTLNWSDRVQTTSLLGYLGVQVPTITSVVWSHSEEGDGRGWQVRISGSGFQSGATVVVDGRPEGTVLSVTPTTLTALLPESGAGGVPAHIGVSNPDGSAADTDQLTSAGTRHTKSTPPPDGTPGDSGSSHGDNTGGTGKGGDNHSSGSPESTPPASVTPSPTETPDLSH